MMRFQKNAAIRNLGEIIYCSFFKKQSRISKYWKAALFLVLIWPCILSCSVQPESLKKQPERQNQTLISSLIETQIEAIDQTVTAVQFMTATVAQSPVATNTPSITNTASLIPDTPTPSLVPRTATPTLSADYFHGSYTYDLPLITQSDLKFRGSPTKLGCTAASVEMILDFWNTYQNEYPTISAQTLINLNTAQGTFHAKTGLSIENVEDELKNNHYYLGIQRNSTKEDLLDALVRYGPLAVLTKTEWTPFGANHLVVLKEYDAENDTVTFLDPWYEWPVTWDWEAFDGIWSLNYSEEENGYLTRTFFFIVPLKEIRPGNDLFLPDTDHL